MAKYILSYIAVPLSAYELETIAKLYCETKDWRYISKCIVDENILQKGKISSRKRLFIELKKRIQTLTDAQLSFFTNASSSDAKNMAILSCFKLYGFIYDFAVEVMRRKLLESDYEAFYESKRVAYENLNEISDSTQKKLKQVMFKIFEQAGFIDSVKTKLIQKPYLSEEMIRLIVEDDPKYLSAFLYSDADIKTLKMRFE